jgi:CheY-like chemotaxis protein/HPt (histidine-containing phosphotransfer) domain-containing protein
LLEDCGLRVSEAEHGQAALDLLERQPCDLILMDMQMPVMDGRTATRLLRERGVSLPILALTANAMKGFERELEEAGFSGFLTKPVDVDALLHELARRLGGEPVEAPAAPEAEAPQALPDAPLVSRLAGHPRLGRIVERFVEQLPAKLAEMQRAADAADMAGLEALGHWLKGAGGSMGFDELFEPSRELEDAAKRGDVTAARDGVARLHSLAGRIRPAATPAPAARTDTLTA